MATAEPRSYSAFVAALVDILEQRGIPYAIAGSLASGLYGEPRTTLDVDLTIQLAQSMVATLARDVRALDLAVDDVAIRERLRQASPQAFNIIDPFAGWKADCYPLRDAEFDQSAFARKRQVEFPASAAGSIWVYAPEDVILYKLVYYKLSDGVSVKHLRDIAGILVNAGSIGVRLDETYLDRWAERLDVAEIWNEIRRARGAVR